MSDPNNVKKVFNELKGMGLIEPDIQLKEIEGNIIFEHPLLYLFISIIGGVVVLIFHITFTDTTPFMVVGILFLMIEFTCNQRRMEWGMLTITWLTVLGLSMLFTSITLTLIGWW